MSASTSDGERARDEGAGASSAEAGAAEAGDELKLNDDEWRRRLSPQQFLILREKGTDQPFTGRFTHPGADGVYRCAACGAELFGAAAQFDSGSGWPSFTQPVSADRVELHEDHSHDMVRTEVTCKRCGGHLGHVFDDGPGPSHERWCINSTSLELNGEAG